MNTKGNKSIFLDGALRAISVFCDYTDYVSMFGSIPLELGVIRNKTLLLDVLNKKVPGTNITESKLVSRKECLENLLDKWISKPLYKKTNGAWPLAEDFEQFFEFLEEFIDEGNTSTEAMHIKLTGSNWEYDAEGLVIEDSTEAYFLFFMYSD